MSALRIVNIVEGVLELHRHICIIIEHTTYDTLHIFGILDAVFEV